MKMDQSPADSVAQTVNNITNMSSTSSNNPFLEIQGAEESEQENLPERIDCYVIVNIDPRCCGPLARELNALLPLRQATSGEVGGAGGASVDSLLTGSSDDKLSVSSSFPRTDHLKRIRRRPATEEELAERRRILEEEENSKKDNANNPDRESSTGDNDSSTAGPNSQTRPEKRKNDENESNNSNDDSNGNDKQSEVDKSNLESTTELQSEKSKTKKKGNKNKQSSKSTISTYSLDLLVGSVEAVDDWLSRSNQYKDTSTTTTATSTANAKNSNVINPKSNNSQGKVSLTSILSKYHLSPIHSNNDNPQFQRKSLPGRPAHTREELEEWNKALWHTLFFEKKTMQFKEEQLALTEEEVEMMKRGLCEALEDGDLAKKQWNDWRKSQLGGGGIEVDDCNYPPSFLNGVVVMDPSTGNIISRASQERQKQAMPERLEGEKSGAASQKIDGNAEQPSSKTTDATTTAKQWASFPDEANLLCTPVLLAIQGVSRRERMTASGYGMHSDEFRMGQYLCTGYDVYLVKEPNIFEAMALVHSRVRRVIFGVSDEGMGGLGGPAATVSGIHSLPGTNHHYRAFRFDTSILDTDTALVESASENLDQIVLKLKRWLIR